MKINLSIISTSFILGILFAVAIYQAVTIYKFRTLVNNDHATLVQVVNFLNTQIQASQNNQSKGGQDNAQNTNPNVLFQQ